jgi:hypothetical protein
LGDNAVAPGACIVAAPVAGEVAAVTGADIEAATGRHGRASGNAGTGTIQMSPKLKSAPSARR